MSRAAYIHILALSASLDCFWTHLIQARYFVGTLMLQETEGPTVTRLIFPQLMNPSSPPEETQLRAQGVTHTWLSQWLDVIEEVMRVAWEGTCSFRTICQAGGGLEGSGQSGF